MKYQDPLDLLWITTAKRIGLTLKRSEHAYASTDGAGTLFIADNGELDSDDCLGQMIFHEICHSLIEGREAFYTPDWGLHNDTEEHIPNEIACIRLQAALTTPYGLDEFFAPTTDFRERYDKVKENPLFPRSDPTVVMAIRGLQRSRQLPWGPHLERALEQTAKISQVMRSYIDDDDELWNTVKAPLAEHPLVFLPYVGPPVLNGITPACENCGWKYMGGRGKAVSRCRQAEEINAPSRIPENAGPCIRWEPAPECQECGACCREAYQSVTISRTDPVRKAHPELVADRGSYLEILRDGKNCTALEISGTSYACTIYENRPVCCRELAASGKHCLTARQRLGLSV